MVEYKTIQIAKFTCDGCYEVENVDFGRGLPKGWKEIDIRHYCPHCTCSHSCERHCR